MNRRSFGNRISFISRRFRFRSKCKGSSEQVTVATPWSALTCQRFGRLRPVATTVWLSLFKHRRQAASDQGADRSAHSKKLPLLLVQSFLTCVGHLGHLKNVTVRK